ncbi:MAG TPA: cytochrome c [Terriglobales bacterium]
MKIYCVALLLLFFSAALFAQTPSISSLTGNPVFQDKCARCHGKNAEGRFLHAPSLVSDKVISASTDELRGIVTNGKGHMPKWGGKLTSDEINMLVDEIKAGKK